MNNQTHIQQERKEISHTTLANTSQDFSDGLTSFRTLSFSSPADFFEIPEEYEARLKELVRRQKVVLTPLEKFYFKYPYWDGL